MNQANHVKLLAPLLVSVLASFSLSMAPSRAQAQNEGHDCIAEGEDNLLCLSLPSGGTEVEDQIASNQQAQEHGQARTTVRAGTPRKISMLTQADLTASSSLETEFNREAILNPATVAEQKAQLKPLAQVEAFKANRQVQDLYIFLNLNDRTGGTGDTSVISAGQK